MEACMVITREEAAKIIRRGVAPSPLYELSLRRKRGSLLSYRKVKKICKLWPINVMYDPKKFNCQEFTQVRNATIKIFGFLDKEAEYTYWCGLIHYSDHNAVWFISEKKRLLILEPQTSRIHMPWSLQLGPVFKVGT